MLARQNLVTTFPALIAHCCKLLCETLTLDWTACFCQEALLQLLLIIALMAMITIGVGFYTLGLMGTVCVRCIAETCYWLGAIVIFVREQWLEARAHVSAV
jgi:hypothetical protein